jgi:hypothetical protein
MTEFARDRPIEVYQPSTSTESNRLPTKVSNWYMNVYGVIGDIEATGIAGVACIPWGSIDFIYQEKR